LLIQTKKIAPQHIPAIKLLLDQQFGKDYLSEEALLIFTQQPHFGLVALDGVEVIGVSLVKIGKTTTLVQELLSERNWFRDYFGRNKTIALRKHLAVNSNYQGKGIGKRLVTDGIKQLRPMVDYIISIVWKESAEHSLGKLLQKVGATPVKTSPNYWEEDSLIKQYDCPICGQPPCGCSTMIYSIDCSK
jgi:predicted N-acetyltransferase YhbS